MNSVRVELDHEGIRALLKSREMEELVEDQAKAMARRAGAGEVKTFNTGDRARALFIGKMDEGNSALKAMR